MGKYLVTFNKLATKEFDAKSYEGARQQAEDFLLSDEANDLDWTEEEIQEVEEYE